jgi:archaellin
VKWQNLLLAGIVIALVSVTGCTGDAPPAPVPAVAAIEPGQVLYVAGDVTGDGIPRGTIDTITITLGLVPGQNPADIEKISIVYADAIRSETLVPVEGFRGDPPQGTWGILTVNGELGGLNNRIEYEEKFVLRLNPKAPLVPRQLVTISITTEDGTTLSIRRISPTVIIKENNYLATV